MQTQNPKKNRLVNDMLQQMYRLAYEILLQMCLFGFLNHPSQISWTLESERIQRGARKMTCQKQSENETTLYALKFRRLRVQRGPSTDDALLDD